MVHSGRGRVASTRRMTGQPRQHGLTGVGVLIGVWRMVEGVRQDLANRIEAVDRRVDSVNTRIDNHPAGRPPALKHLKATEVAPADRRVCPPGNASCWTTCASARENTSDPQQAQLKWRPERRPRTTGPVTAHNRAETEAEQAERLREVEATIAVMEQWNR